MSRYLRDIDLYVPPSEGEYARDWALSTNFLEVLYLNCLARVETGGVPKVVLRPCRTRPAKSLEVALHKPDILQFSKLFDFDTYFASDKETRKRIALDFLQNGILAVAKARGWNMKPFHDAYKAVLAKNFVCYRPWSKPITSPDRKHKAQVWCNYASDKAEIFIVIFRRNEIANKTLVATVKPGDVWIRGAVGKLAWLSSDKVKLTSHDGSESWETAPLAATTR